jgi:thiol-disulfide isomerase/thioredoxin
MHQDKIKINLELKMDNFERNLQQIINKFGVDSGVGIPDFVLAQVINEMLEKAEGQSTANMAIPVTDAELIAARKKVIAILMAALSDMSMVD